MRPSRDTLHSFDGKHFRASLLGWFRRNKREMPWRKVRSPYRTWISEMMLQQTQVKTVIPYFERWMKALPTIQALAKADEHRVLSLWQGLGYYARARQIVKAARVLVKDHNGRLPDTYEAITSVPGIGPYSAGAILSIAYGKKVPAVDGNVLRVFARLFAIQDDILQPATRLRVSGLVEALMPDKNCGDFTEALMELGATVCTPKNPSCGKCPVRAHCTAQELGLTTTLPVKAKRAAVQKVQACAVVAHKQGRYFIWKRPEGQIMGGLWEFPEWKFEDKNSNGKTKDTSDPKARRNFAAAQLGLPAARLNYVKSIKRNYTRFVEDLAVFSVDWTGRNLPNSARWESAWLRPEQMPGYPLTSAHAKIRDFILSRPASPLAAVRS